MRRGTTVVLALLLVLIVGAMIAQLIFAPSVP